MSTCPLYVEPFAGAAAVALQLLGGPGCLPPVSWMGGKRRLAPVILDRLGLVPGQGAGRVVLCDAGPWGWVWPALLDPEVSAQVSATLRGWAGEPIQALWFRLRDEGPRADPAEAVAQWLLLQARSASGAPVFWRDGAVLLQGSGEGRSPQPAGQRNPTMSDPRLVASDGRGVIRAAGIKGDKPRLRRGHDGGADRPADQKGRNAAGCGGLVRIETLADRVEDLGRVLRPWRRSIRVVAGRAEELPDMLPSDLRGAVVYLDPPYRGATGYGWDVARGDLLAMADGYVRRGARVAISEAVGLAGDLGWGWRQEEVTMGRKPEWLTVHGCPRGRYVGMPLLAGVSP